MYKHIYCVSPLFPLSLPLHHQPTTLNIYHHHHPSPSPPPITATTITCHHPLHHLSHIDERVVVTPRRQWWFMNDVIGWFNFRR
ncbi:hypothetical protein Hanom_Chr01g00052311 [Helianthus anomalus]